MKSYTLIILVLLIGITSCSKPSKLEEQNFYYWKTTYDIDEATEQTLTNNDSKKIYTRLCDITLGFDKKPHPQNVLKWKTKANENLEYIPVIFVEHKIFIAEDSELESNNTKYLTRSEVSKLANNVVKLAKTTWEYSDLPLNEIQIDCDWTQSSRELYFHFLKELNNLCDEIELSATIRLHQIKYPEKTGIPPIDKGSLMCYNMDDMNDSKTENSIFSVDVLKQYINSEKVYNNMPMSFALPVFSWNLAYREDKFVGIVREIEDLANSPDFKSIGGNKYRVIDRTWKYNLQKNDVIRHESAKAEDIARSFEYLKANLPNWNGEVIYFDLNKNVNRQYEKSILPFSSN
jgi:hypothetical protein